MRDLSLRALDILGSADVVAAEDTRVSAKLLSHYGISKKLISLHQHNEKRSVSVMTALLAEGNSVALISDAGTPGVSDPGAIVIAGVRRVGYPVVPIPGPNAALAALSVSGFTNPHFLFFGFLSARSSARRKELETLRALPYTLVFYESPHRIIASLADILALLGDREMTLAREITKVFETIHSCSLSAMQAWIQADANRTRGEFVLLIDGAEPKRDILTEEVLRVLRLLSAELPLTQAVKLAAEITGEKKNKVYEIALTLKRND